MVGIDAIDFVGTWLLSAFFVCLFIFTYLNVYWSFEEPEDDDDSAYSENPELSLPCDIFSRV